jgi:glycerol-3-phosphate dehydrogenase
MARMRAETFDLAVIGGGINGAAIARDAAMRGLRVALVDKGDFAGATSSRSSKLIHGGLRYLPQGQLRLVYEGLRERERLRRVTAPHLVRPIRFLYPFYRGRRPGRLAVRAGLALYDLFARMPSDERHRSLDAAGVVALEPALAHDALSGGALYSDGWGDDARLTLENVLDAAYHGAAVANYIAVEDFNRVGDRIAAAGVRDLERGAAFELRALRFVNAAGPWVDHVRGLDERGAAPAVRLTKGVHLVIDAARLTVSNPLVLSDDGGRIVFVMPHGSAILVGTTDTDFAGDPAQVAADAADVDYLLAVLVDSLPGLRLTADDVAHSFAGLRALIVSGGWRRPSALPREELIFESRSGLLTVAGGKLTTHRQIAERVVDRVMRSLGRSISRSPTRDTPLPGARDAIEYVDGAARSDAVSHVLPADVNQMLTARYGSRAGSIALIAQENPVLATPLAAGAPAIGAEVIHGVRFEMARTVADFIVRRTAMTWRAPSAAIAAAPAVAHLMAVELGWDRAREAAEAAPFRASPAPAASEGPIDGRDGRRATPA